MEAARPARMEDVPTVVELAQGAIDELRPNRGGAVWSRREAHSEPVGGLVTDAINSPEGPVSVFVGTIDEVIVGYAISHIETLHDGARIEVISDIYVLGEARGVGVGEALMDAVAASAVSHGAEGIDALVLPGDRHSKNFFETFGLTARAILVHRSLTKEES